MDILAALRQEEANLRKQWDRVRRAIAALADAPEPTFGQRANAGTRMRPKRVVPPALRAHLSRKAKERWARIRAQKTKRTK
jgi:hypothetical protein